MKFLADLVVPDVASLNVNKCTNYTSNNTAVDLLDVKSAVIDNKVTEQIRESPVVTLLIYVLKMTASRTTPDARQITKHLPCGIRKQSSYESYGN